jgi:DNA-directed RNA polymerase specialized sigma24 family protein
VQRETNLGGERRDFPQTRRSLVARIGAGEPAERRAAQGELIATYWKPVYAYLRLRWRHDNERAKDATQGFFAAVIEKHWLADFDPARARFRAYLRACVDRFVANEERARAAQRRGGDVAHVELDFDGAESELGRRDPPDPNTLDAWFENEWRRSVLAGALADLERECEARGQRTRFEAFRRYDVEPGSASERPTYDELARELGIPVHAVTNALAAARREFRERVLERLRAAAHDEDEYQAELRALFGAEDERA